jgi:hypothetical protein
MLLAALAGFRAVQRWFDVDWPFADNLWLAV